MAQQSQAGIATPTSYRFVRSLGGHDNEVAAVVFHPGDQTLISVGRDSKINFWNPVTGKLLRTLEHEAAWCAAFNQEGTLFATGGLDTGAEVWRTASGERIRKLGSTYEEVGGHRSDSVYAVAFSPDGRLLAWGDTTQPQKERQGLQYQIFVMDLGNGRNIVTLSGAEALALVFTPDGHRLIAAGETGIDVWDTATWKQEYNVKSVKPLALTLSSDGKLIASGGEDRTVTLFDAATGKKLRTLTGVSGKVRSLAFSPDSRLLAAGGWGEVRLWETTNWTLTQILPHPAPARSLGSGVNSVAFSPDGWLATGGMDRNRVRVWEKK